MRREAVWSTWDATGAEHLALEVMQEGIVADGLSVGVVKRPFRIRYEVRCEANWSTSTVRVSTPIFNTTEAPFVELLADGKGNWTAPSGEYLPDLEGCIDVDISATPFTNTLPIRRLGLEPGQSAELSVAYVDVHKMRVWREEQHYTCLEKNSASGVYRYESLDGGFTADLPVDKDGLVLDYPGLFRRILF